MFWFCFDFSGILSAIKDIYHVLLASSQRYNLMVSGILFFLFILIFTVFTKMTRAYVKKEVLENFQKEKKRKEKKKK